MKSKFIVTTSEESAEILEAAGFELISYSTGQWTFLNNGKLQFSNLKKISFTNKINFASRLVD